MIPSYVIVTLHVQNIEREMKSNGVQEKNKLRALGLKGGIT